MKRKVKFRATSVELEKTVLIHLLSFAQSTLPRYTTSPEVSIPP